MPIKIDKQLCTTCGIALSVLFVADSAAEAQETNGAAASAQPEPAANQIIAWSQPMVTPDGIDESRAVEIGGIKQWIRVRGNHRANPILLYIHGGPGFAVMPVSWSFQRPWEEYFTVVQWDERGAGKTYGANDPAKVMPTLGLERMTDDALELIQYLHATYHKRKIFVLGHSFGSAIGLRVAQVHPEWLYAYLGVGQVVKMRKSEQLGYDSILAQARKAKNAQAVLELEALAPFVPASGPLSWPKTKVERKWLNYFGGEIWNRPDSHYFGIASLSPDYSDADMTALHRGLDESVTLLWEDLSDVDFTNVTRFKCPVLLFHGRHDLSTSHVVVAEWYQRVKAPKKKLVWFEDSAHMPMMEEPGKFLVQLVKDARPLANIHE